MIDGPSGEVKWTSLKGQSHRPEHPDRGHVPQGHVPFFLNRQAGLTYNTAGTRARVPPIHLSFEGGRHAPRHHQERDPGQHHQPEIRLHLSSLHHPHPALGLHRAFRTTGPRRRSTTASLALNKKNLESQPNYSSLAGIGVKVSKPPQVLGTVVTGIEEAVGRVAPVNIAADPNLVESKYSSNPVFAVFGALDLMFIVKIVLSLFAILFTYDAIVGEKEKGTLKLALSNDVPRDRLILGKAIGGYISLLLPLLIPLLLSLLFLLIVPDVSLGGQDWARLMLIFLMFFLYLSVFFSLGLFVSARTSRSSTSFLVLLFVWVIIVMVIPKAAVITAGQVRPIPSVHEITAKKDAFLQQIQTEGQKEVRDWVTKNQADAVKDPKAWQDKFKQYLQDFQQEADDEDRREQRRARARLPAEENGPSRAWPSTCRGSRRPRP